jgi:transcriptional regulator with XRE-family HTH domain
MTNPKKLNIVGPRLQLLRKWRRMTQSDLSAKLCLLGWRVSRDGLAQMEITTKRITDFDLIFLAKALGVKVTDFFPATFSQQNLRPKIKSRRLMELHLLRPHRTKAAQR